MSIIRDWLRYRRIAGREWPCYLRHLWNRWMLRRHIKALVWRWKP